MIDRLFMVEELRNAWEFTRLFQLVYMLPGSYESKTRRMICSSREMNTN